MDIQVRVYNQKLNITTNLKTLISGTQEFIRFIFDLPEDWDNLTIFAQFRQDDVAYNQYLDENKSAYLPSEIKPGQCTLMLYGVKDTIIATSNFLTLTINKNALISDAQSTNISDSLYSQLVGKVNEMIQKFDALSIASNPDASAYAEIINARSTYATLNDRLNNIDLSIQTTNDNVDIVNVFPNQVWNLVGNHINFKDTTGWQKINSGTLTVANSLLVAQSTSSDSNLIIWSELLKEVKLNSNANILIKIRARCISGNNSIVKPLWSLNGNPSIITPEYIVASNSNLDSAINWSIDANWYDMWLIAKDEAAQKSINQIGLSISSNTKVEISHIEVYYNIDDIVVKFKEVENISNELKNNNFNSFASFPNQSVNIMLNSKNFEYYNGVDKWEILNGGSVSVDSGIMKLTSTNNLGAYGNLSKNISVSNSESILIKACMRCASGGESIVEPCWRGSTNGTYIQSENITAGNLDGTTANGVSWTVGSDWKDVWLIAKGDNENKVINDIGVFVKTGTAIEILYFDVFYSEDSFDNIYSDLAQHSADIARIDGDENTEGSVSYKISQAQTAFTENTINPIVDDIINPLNTRLETAEGEIDSLQTSVNDNDERIDSLAQRIGYAETKITTLNGGVNLDGSVDNKINAAKIALQESIAENSSNITEIDNLVSANKNSIDSLTLRATSAEENIEAAQADISNLQTEVIEYIDSKQLVNGMLLDSNNNLYLTSNGDIISDPVELPQGGSGSGTGVQTVLTLLNENEGTTITVANNSPVELKFNFTSTENDTPTGNGTAKIIVDGVLKATYEISQGSNTVDVQKYLDEGINIVKVVCVDVYGNYKSLTYSVTVVALSLSSTFDDTLIYDGDITFKFIPYGTISKKILFIVDGETVDTITTLSSGKQMTKVFNSMSHGVHRIIVYATATFNGITITSNKLVYEIVCTEKENNNVIIASPYNVTNVVQGELVSIPFTVYNPQNSLADIQLSILNGDDTVIYTQNRTVNRTRQVWNMREYPVGTVKFKITSGDTSREFTLRVSENNIPVQPITDNLELYLSSMNRSNNETNFNLWDYKDISTTFTDVNWDTTGWKQDSKGDTVLKLFGDAKAEINFKPFDTDLRISGKTLEFEFTARDVNNSDAVIVSCMDNNIGFEITANKALLKSEQNSVECFFKDEEKIRVAFTIENNNEHRLMSIYINGILSGTTQYPANDNFQQPSPVNITIGSELCGIDLYTIRSYSTALSYLDIRDNYIADTTDVIKKVDLYKDNLVYDDYNNISYELLKAKLPVIILTGSLPQSKGDVKIVSVKYENPYNPELNFEDNCTIDIQNDDSQLNDYKDWKLIFTNKHQHAYRQLSASTFSLSADFKDSTGTYNTQNSNLLGAIYDSKTPPQEINPLVRTTIYGLPCVVFEQKANGGDVVFAGKYNFNFDEDSNDVYGFTSDYPLSQSWKFRNNTSDACLFHSEIPADWSVDFESRYPNNNKDIQYFKRMHDWVVSTYQDAATGNTLNSVYIDCDNISHNVDNAEYRLAKFKTEFEDYFDKDFCTLYYVYTFVMLMINQRAENMVLTTWDRQHWQPWFYDNESCFGVNDEGTNTFNYYHEDIDKLNGVNVYNGQDSALWVNFRQAFADDIKVLYQNLRNSKKLTYDTVIDYFINNGSNKWSISVYNEDAMHKYISMLINGNDVNNLSLVKGSDEERFKYFIKNRLSYCDSKWYSADYANDCISLRIYTPDSYLSIKPNANIKVTPYSNMYAGVRYKENGTLCQVRATKNNQITFLAPNETFNNTEAIIYGASELSSIGDLAPLYCGSVNVSKAARLISLKVGDKSSGYTNPYLRELKFGNNRLLQTIDVRNCPNLSEPLILKDCPNILEVYADGSGITGVELPSSGYLKTLQLPATVTNLTVRNQKHIETFSMPSYENISTLWIEDCVNVPVDTIVKSVPNISRIRLINVDLTFANSEIIEHFMECGGIDENGNNTEKSIITGTAHFTTIPQTILDKIAVYYPDLSVTYDSLFNEYTVTFYDEDGTTVLDTQRVIEGRSAVDPVSSGRIPKPTKQGNAQYSYPFNGWSGSYTNVYTNRTVKATYKQTINSYTVRFINGETVMQTLTIQYGKGAIYSGEIPTSGNDIFCGWLPSVTNIQGDIDTYAQFTRYEIPETITPFGECSWANIKAVADAGYVNDEGNWCINRNGIEEAWWSIGDEKTITMNDGEEITFMIYDFLHDDKVSGGKAPLTIGMKNLMKSTFRMNKSSTNAGGWDKCYFRQPTDSSYPALPTIVNKMPYDMKLAMCEVYKRTMEGSKSPNILTSKDKVFMFSEVEVFGTTSTGYKDEGYLYPIFTSNTSRIKRLSNGTGSAYYWWLRTPYLAYTSSFRYVGNGGYISNNSANYSNGVALGFCI